MAGKKKGLIRHKYDQITIVETLDAKMLNPECQEHKNRGAVSPSALLGTTHTSVPVGCSLISAAPLGIFLAETVSVELNHTLLLDIALVWIFAVALPL